MLISRTYLICILGLLLTSCASYKTKYADKPVEKITGSQGDPDFTLFLVGDAGNAPEGSSTPLLSALRPLFSEASENSALIWLGDNIYPVGMPPANDPTYALAEHRLNKQLESTDLYPGKIFFIPGNHDWYEYGAQGVIRQEKYIESYLSNRPAHNEQDNYFIPDTACGSIHLVTLTEDLDLVLMDSHWYLKGDRSLLSHCRDTSQTWFLEELEKTVAKSKAKTIIVSLHHPPYTYGSHGSRFTFRDYAFPFTQISKKVILPLPFSGIVVNQMRAFITSQDNKHPDYVALKNKISSITKRFDNVIVASGHDHNLQYIVQEGINYIVSGAGSKSTAVGMGDGSQFATARKGFARLDFFESEITIEFLSVDDNSHSLESLYYSKMITKKE